MKSIKFIILVCVCVAAFALNAAEPAATAFVSVDVMNKIGPIRPMNAVNNGPSLQNPAGDQKVDRGSVLIQTEIKIVHRLYLA